MDHSDAPPRGIQSSSGKPNVPSGGKRKPEAPPSISVDAKRPKSLSTACNECKRRKIKCNRHMPCRRCRNLSLTCIYSQKITSISLNDSSGYQELSVTVSSLRQELERVKSDLARLNDERQTSYAADALLNVHHAASTPSSSWGIVPRSLHQVANGKSKVIEQFHGPTSSTYGFNVAKSSLQTMGINHDPVEEEDLPTHETRSHSDRTDSERIPDSPAEDPIWILTHADAVRLTRLYDEQCGVLYPVTSTEPVMAHIDWLFDPSRTGRRDLSSLSSVEKDLTEITKLIVAIGLLLEGDGKSERAQKLFESLESTISTNILSSPSIHSLVLLVLAATYLFHADKEGQAWRLIGMSGRLCYEMGLHRRESVFKNFKNEEDMQIAIRIFWIIYGLDRRWSFGTGMPFALQDADIDPLLPEPDDSALYLKHITHCNKIMSKVWSFNVSYDLNKECHSTEIDFLDFQIRKWYEELPESLKYGGVKAPEEEASQHGTTKLSVLIALRANLARIQIYRPILHSATSTIQNIRQAQRVVSVAKDTISLLIHVNQSSNLYATQQVLYNYFLIQALAVIFLATSHAPAEFLSQTRKEFYGALGLIRGFGENSYISKRLWSTIRDLKDLREKIGALGHGERDQNIRNGHQPQQQERGGGGGGGGGEELFFPSPDPSLTADFHPSPASAPLSGEAGQKMSSELGRLFERLGQGRGHRFRPQNGSSENQEFGGGGGRDDLLRWQSFVGANPTGNAKEGDLPPLLPEHSPDMGVGCAMMGHEEGQNGFSRIWAELL